MINMVKELKGADMDIDLLSNPNIAWKKDKCPWNEKENNENHKCAIKGVSICKHFLGIKDPDIVICNYEE